MLRSIDGEDKHPFSVRRMPTLSPTAPSVNRQERTLISAAAQQARLKCLAEGPHSDLARWAPPSRWRGPPLSDG